MTNTVTLPWPHKDLNPNARVHYKAKARIAKKYKETCFYLCKEAKLKNPRGAFFLTVELYPPTRRRHDTDNAYASLKSGLDGLAAAIGVDDSNFKEVRLSMKDEIGGMVKITITGVEE